MAFQLECRMCRRIEMVPKRPSPEEEVFVVEYLCSKCKREINNRIRMILKKPSDE